MKTLFRTAAIVILFVMGTLVVSQVGDDNLAPQEEGLSTQALNVCSGVLCDRIIIRRIYVNTNGYLYVSTSGTETDLTCTPVSSNYLRISDQAKNYKEIYTTLLAAKLSNSRVTIRATSASACTIQYVYLGDN